MRQLRRCPRRMCIRSLCGRRASFGQMVTSEAEVGRGRVFLPAIGPQSIQLLLDSQERSCVQHFRRLPSSKNGSSGGTESDGISWPGFSFSILLCRLAASCRFLALKIVSQNRPGLARKGNRQGDRGEHCEFGDPSGSLVSQASSMPSSSGRTKFSWELSKPLLSSGHRLETGATLAMSLLVSLGMRVRVDMRIGMGMRMDVMMLVPMLMLVPRVMRHIRAGERHGLA